MTDPLAGYSRDLTPVEAAGGIVIRRRPSSEVEVLMILRRGVWDLPKGKLDPGETPAEGAVREVEEETGAAQLHLIRGAGLTLHRYVENEQTVLKTTWWFLMSSPSQEFVPEEREQIEDVRWIEWSEAVDLAGYPNLKRHLRNLTHLVKTVDPTPEES